MLASSMNIAKRLSLLLNEGAVRGRPPQPPKDSQVRSVIFMKKLVAQRGKLSEPQRWRRLGTFIRGTQRLVR